MLKEILSKLMEWGLTHMLSPISRRLYPDKKIIDRIRISIKGASIYLPPKLPLVRMTLEIRNSLASSIELHSIHGDVKTNGYTLFNNFTKILAETLKEHSDKADCEIALDLPGANAKDASNHIADNFPLYLRGTLVFSAMGRALTKAIELDVNADIQGLHGKSVENSK
jgi:hypothetical protein